MFRILNKATKEHKYKIYNCWISGQKAGFWHVDTNVKISDTTLRSKKGIFCEKKIKGKWTPLTEDEALDLIEIFNDIRLSKSFLPIEFNRFSDQNQSTNEK